MISIRSNGSKWYGEQPDSLNALLEVLATEPLSSTFEDYGNFVLDLTRKDGAPTDVKRFWGNFARVSHVFEIDTDEPELIETLTAAIRANQQSAAYLVCRQEGVR